MAENVFKLLENTSQNESRHNNKQTVTTTHVQQGIIEVVNPAVLVIFRVCLDDEYNGELTDDCFTDVQRSRVSYGTIHTIQQNALYM